MKFESIQFEVIFIVVVNMTLNILNDPVLSVDVKLSVLKASRVEKLMLSSIISIRIETLFIVRAVNAEYGDGSL